MKTRTRSVKGFVYGGKSRSRSARRMKAFVYGGKRSMKSFVYGGKSRRRHNSKRRAKSRSSTMKGFIY
jgi:hypothetical protein